MQNFKKIFTRIENRPEHPVYELIKFAILALLVVVPIRTFIAQPFIVSGSSMLPTFSDGEYLIVDELSYRLHDPKRGDVIIFKYPKDPSKYFIKRIIGLPGEKIAIEGKKIIITNSEHPDGLMLTEPYINNGTESHLSVTLGEGEYFVLGDNRSASSDSRVWGSVPKKLIIGRALIRLTPIREISILPGDYKNF